MRRRKQKYGMVTMCIGTGMGAAGIFEAMLKQCRGAPCDTVACVRCLRASCGSSAVRRAAAEVGGVKLNDKVDIAGHDLVLNGAGVRTRVVFKVYVASLYLPKKATDLQGVLAQQPRHIELDMLRTLSADQLVDALDEGLEANNTPAEMAAVKAQADQLAATMNAFKEVKEGDVVTLDFVDGATRVGLNGQPKGTIAGEAFNQALTKSGWATSRCRTDLRRRCSAASRVVPGMTGASSGYRLLAEAAGRLVVTDDFLRSSAAAGARADPESCAAELALHDALTRRPRRVRASRW